MALNTTPVNILNTTLYASSGDSAVTYLSFCNYSAATVTVSVYIVPDGDSPGNDNILIKDLEITATDTFVAYEGGEKLLFADGDQIVAICSAASSVTAVTSYISI